MRNIFKSCIWCGIALTVFASSLNAQTPSTTLTWNASATAGVTGYNIYRRGTGGMTKIAGPVQSPYKDTTVETGVTYTYTARSVKAGVEGVDSIPVTAVILGNPPPPPPIGFKDLDCIKLTADSNIRGSAPNNNLGLPLYGVEPAGAQGCIPAGGVTTAVIPNFPTGGPVWIKVKFTAPCSTISAAPSCTGYVGSDHLTLSAAPPPPSPSMGTPVCTAAPLKAAFPTANMPAGTMMTVTATVAGISKACMVPLP